MTTLLQHNARLVAIKGDGFSENYDQAEGTDTVKWSGDADAYIYDEVLTEMTGGVLNELTQTRITIPSNLGVSIEPEDTIEYVKEGVTYPRKVREVVSPPFLGITRLHLVDA